jgi:hypothetical protein
VTPAVSIQKQNVAVTKRQTDRDEKEYLRPIKVGASHLCFRKLKVNILNNQFASIKDISRDEVKSASVT